MEKDNSCKLESAPVPIQAFSRRDQQAKGYTHVVAKNAAISFKISTSVLYVSSKPGVSTRSTRRPSSVNSLAIWTSAVQDFKFAPIRRLEPLPILTNCRLGVSLFKRIALSNSRKFSRFLSLPSRCADN